MVTSVIEAVAAHAKTAPWRPAILVASGDSWRQLSRADLWASVEYWAKILHDRDHARIDAERRVVIIMLRHGVDAYCTYLGAMRVGLLPCFMPYPTPKQDAALYWQAHRTIFERIDPLLIISYSEILADLRKIASAKAKVIDVEAPPAPSSCNLPAMNDPVVSNTPALLQHSSGTTGLKKGVVLTHEQVASQITAYTDKLSMTQADTVATWLPLYHDMGLITGFLLPLAMGSTIISLDAFDWVTRPDILLIAIERFGATLCWLPNFAFAHLVRTADRSGKYNLSSIRAFIDCSEPCRAETLEHFEHQFSSCGLSTSALQTCYAMAETVFAVTQTDLSVTPRVVFADRDLITGHSIVRLRDVHDASTVRLVSCGTPVNGTSLRIVPSNPAGLDVIAEGDTGQSKPTAVGEVQIRSNSMFSGYFRDGAKSAAAFDGGWYRSGDLGFIHDGELFITGRSKDLIIVHGRNFYAHDIELVVNGVSGVKPGRAVAFGSYREAAGSDEAIVLAELIDPSLTDFVLIERDIKRAVFSKLGLTLFRVELVPAGELVKTTSGKLSREENRRRFELGRAA